MGAHQSKISGTSDLTASDSLAIPDFIKHFPSNLRLIDADSTQTLNQITNTQDINSPMAPPNRFTVKATLKVPTSNSPPELENDTSKSCNFASSAVSPTGSEFYPTKDDGEIGSPTSILTCWSCYGDRRRRRRRDASSARDSIETYESSGAGSSSRQSESMVSTTNLSTTTSSSMSSRLSLRPQKIQLSPLYQSRNGDFYVAFEGANQVFSNEYVCPNGVEFKGHRFPTSEHCFLYQKAQFCGDKQLASRILEQEDIEKVREFMASLQTMNHNRWSKKEIDVMRQICTAKFEQNPALRSELFRTGNATLVNATLDCRWGVGLGPDDADIADPLHWTGRNLLGQILMAIRSLMGAQYAQELENERHVVEKRQQKFSTRKCI